MQRFFGIYQGKVIDNDDPERLGRCKVSVPAINGAIDDPEILPWSHYITAGTTGPNRGSFILPELGDVVWVMYQNGLKDNPVYLGSSYAREEPPISEDDYFTTKVVYSDNDGVQIKRTKDELILLYNDSKIKLKQDGDISIHASKDILIEAEGNIKLLAERIDLNE